MTCRSNCLSRRLLGPEAKTPWVASVWKELLPVAALGGARAGSTGGMRLSNAIVNLVGDARARPRQWLERMNAIAGECPNVNDDCSECGKILAWQAGMAPIS